MKNRILHFGIIIIPGISFTSKTSTVSQSGLVTGIAEGTAVITDKTTSGKTDTCTVTVKKPAP